MKTLINEINGRKDFPIFEGTNEEIFWWVKMNLDMFSLNELHSCETNFFPSENLILISGDEDYRMLRIVYVEIINL